MKDSSTFLRVLRGLVPAHSVREGWLEADGGGGGRVFGGKRPFAVRVRRPVDWGRGIGTRVLVQVGLLRRND